MGFSNRQLCGPHYNFGVIVSMIMKFGTGIKLDVFYTMVTKKFVMSLLLRNYEVITCILADTKPTFQMLIAPKPPSLIWLKFVIERYFMVLFKYQARFYF